MNLARRGLRGLQRWLPRRDSGLHILAYHLIGAGTSSPVDIDLATFRRQMLELQNSADVVSLDAALTALGDGSLGELLTVVVTFDDAYDNFLRSAWPVLEELEIPATLYVPTGFINGSSPPPIRGTEGLPALSWSQLAELQTSGLVEIGSHTRSHPNLRKLDRQAAWLEISESKDELEQRLGRPVTSFCYPGARWSLELEELVTRSYRSAVIAGGRRIDGSGERAVRLSRLPIRRDMPVSLQPVLGKPVWLEECVAAAVRRFTG